MYITEYTVLVWSPHPVIDITLSEGSCGFYPVVSCAVADSGLNHREKVSAFPFPVPFPLSNTAWGAQFGKHIGFPRIVPPRTASDWGKWYMRDLKALFYGPDLNRSLHMWE